MIFRVMTDLQLTQQVYSADQIHSSKRW